MRQGTKKQLDPRCLHGVPSSFSAIGYSQISDSWNDISFPPFPFFLWDLIGLGEVLCASLVITCEVPLREPQGLRSIVC